MECSIVKKTFDSFHLIQSKLFITSLFITEYSLSDNNLQGTDLFPLKLPLYNRIFLLTSPTVRSGNRYTISIENRFIITEFLPCVSQFGDQVKVLCINRYLSHLIRGKLYIF